MDRSTFLTKKFHLIESNPQSFEEKQLYIDPLEILNSHALLIKKKKRFTLILMISTSSQRYLQFDILNYIGSRVPSLPCLPPKKSEQGWLQLHLPTDMKALVVLSKHSEVLS